MKLSYNDIIDLQTEKHEIIFTILRCEKCNSENMKLISNHNKINSTYREYMCRDCGAITYLT